MNILLICFCIFGGFNERWFINCGTHGDYGRICIEDTDRDMKPELLFGSLGAGLQERIVIFELNEGDTFALQMVIDTVTIEVWAVDDFDADGLYDLLLMGDFGFPVVGLQIYESPDSFSYPANEVWRDTVGPPVVHPICVYDIDKDSIPEIIKVIAPPYGDFVIYESVGDNQYDLIYTDTISTPQSTIAFGDFDQDGSVEFAMGNLSAGAPGAWYWVYECTANNTYEQIVQDAVVTKNIKDCFAVPDADGDGKWEFVVKGYVVPPSSQIDVFIFEASSDNTYEIIDTFVLPGGAYGGGYSAAGDVDGDSIPEIVLEARQNVFIIKAIGNDSFYVWDTLPGNDAGSSIAVYDIDGNGYQEIVISGNDETRIYEYDFGIEEYSGSINKTHDPFATIFRGPLILPEGMNCRIFDITGRVVVHEKMKPGIYFIEIDGVIAEKVVKIR